METPGAAGLGLNIDTVYKQGDSVESWPPRICLWLSVSMHRDHNLWVAKNDVSNLNCIIIVLSLHRFIKEFPEFVNLDFGIFFKCFA